MKKLLIVLLAMWALTGAGCRKPYNDTRVVKVTYPTIALNGAKYVTIDVGTAYADPGATGTDDISGSTRSLTAEYSTLDVNTPGIYYMRYAMTNANGYITKVGRYIAVTNYDDDVDLTGVYERTSNGVQVNVTRVSRAMYMTDDMGGAGLPDAAYFAVIDEATIDLSVQLSESIGEEIDASDEELHVTATDTSFQYRLSAPGYGTALRVFEKVE
ncbi:hypothetical protein GCM10023093_26230 [Nemorincola caseinilytica]|uniref:Pesticidal crystal protein Cry22Aa Ig-like domain-containing protein n=1 Tax=Nemorincola caseinilytica TaxID=2054315 RepID=A0ABP8NKL5_9BACT